MATTRCSGYSSWLLERIATGDAMRLRVGVSSIGRINAIINIFDSNFVSRRHGELRIAENDVVELVDLNSVNGTYVNGVHYQDAKVELHANDRIGVGVLDDREDEPEFPVFRLKYIPLRRPSVRVVEPEVNVARVVAPCSSAAAAATATASTSAAVATSSTSAAAATASTSAAAATASTSSKSSSSTFSSSTMPATSTSKSSAANVLRPESVQPAVSNKTITLSDDEDDGSSSEIQKKPVERKISNGPSKFTTPGFKSDDTVQQAIVTSSTITSKPITSKLACDSITSRSLEDFKTASLPAAGASSASKPTLIIDNQLVSAPFHAPIISEIKREFARSFSENKQSTSRDTEATILECSKDLNPRIGKNLNGNSKNEGYLRNGDVIDLSSDTDEENSEPVESLGALLSANEAPQSIEDEQPKSRLQAKSPNIFESSLNSSKENENNDDEQIKTSDKNCTPKDNVSSTTGDKKRVDSFENDDDHFDMLSQILLDDIKAELASDSEDNDDTDGATVVGVSDATKSTDDLEVRVKIEPLDDVAAPSEVANPKPVGGDCWVISDDDEDYDKDLESKVLDWSMKLLSQKMNMSQAFELSDTAEDNEPDDMDNNVLGLHNEDYDRDYDDYYNNELDDKTRIVDEVYAALALKNGERTDVQKTTTSSSDEHHSSDSEDMQYAADRELLRSEMAPDVDKQPTDIVDASKAKLIDEGDKKSPRADEDISKAKKMLHDESTFITAKEHSSDKSDSSSATKQQIVLEKKRANDAQSEKPNRAGPAIIDAPKLPKHKGKLRGVSAKPHKSSAASTAESVRKRAKLLGEKIKDEHYMCELKRKWLEKPNDAKRREKEEKKLIQESRKERLKELADRQTAEVNKESLKRKIAPSDELDKKKAKVKITAVNRGAFLTEEIKKKAPYKIPKVKQQECSKSKIPAAASSLKIVIPKEQLLAIDNNNSPVAEKPLKIRITKEQLAAHFAKANHSKSKSNDKESICDAFAQEISKADEALLKRQQRKIDAPLTTTTTTLGKSADAVRAQRTTNKITFASMQKNYVESRQNQEMLKELNCSRSCLTNIETRDGNVARVKKKVRFNDSPIVHYIERINGANKKVDCKDLLPKPLVNTRRNSVREHYPIVDCTNQIISMILTWCNEWLVNRNAQFDAASDVLLPMPNQSTSFNHYKSIIFPLMRLEFVSSLEQEMKRCKAKEFQVTIEQVLPKNERLIVFARCSHRKLSDVKSGLVILDWGSISVFAYMVNRRSTGTNGHILVYEIMAEGLSVEKLGCIKNVTVSPVMENVRVEVGAFNAVYQLEKSPLLNEIIDPLELCKYKPHTKRKIKYKGYDKPNPRQLQVLLSTYEKTISGTPNITLIQGPPGTGKSCVISNLVLQLLYGDDERFLDQRVLVCAQSNAAVDVIATKLFGVSQRMRPETMFRLIRYGLLDRINPKVRHASLERTIERGQVRKLQQAYKNLKIPDNTDVKEYLRNEMKQLEMVIDALKLSNIKDTVQEEELLEKQKQFKQMQYIVNGVLRYEDERSIYTWHLENANVVCATLSSCVKLSQYVNYFDVCIIDEATQCTEPWTLLPLRFGINSLVLVGDTQQLPATVLSKKASDFGLGRSLFTRIQSAIESVKGGADAASGAAENNVMFSLQTQYRMHPEICRWPNSYFYKNELINGSVTLHFKTPITPFSVLNLMYSQNDDCMRGQIANEQEARFVAKLVQSLDGYIPIKYNTYGVITPYAQQRTTLERALRETGFADITVNTIDSYQGIERDVIIISNARTTGVGFLSNYQRLNVALTRPRKCLLLCGNFKNLESVPAWRSLLNSARERKVYHEISANCMDNMHRDVIANIKIGTKKAKSPMITGAELE